LSTSSIYTLYYNHLPALLFFFFSSRRRHTRFSRDWSSDVCSSDLPAPRLLRHLRVRPARADGRPARLRPDHPGPVGDDERHRNRSEERRVGEECNTRWTPTYEQSEMM